MLRFLLPLLFCLSLGTSTSTLVGINQTGGLRAQTLPITYEKKLIGYKFKYDNLVVQGINFRNAMAVDPEARAALSGSGGMEIAGLLLGTYGASAALLGVFTDETNDFERKDRNYLIGGGLAGVALGVWLKHLADKKRVRAVDLYNANLPARNANFQPSLQPSVGKDGVGIALRF